MFPSLWWQREPRRGKQNSAKCGTGKTITAQSSWKKQTDYLGFWWCSTDLPPSIGRQEKMNEIVSNPTDFIAQTNVFFEQCTLLHNRMENLVHYSRLHLMEDNLRVIFSWHKIVFDLPQEHLWCRPPHSVTLASTNRSNITGPPLLQCSYGLEQFPPSSSATLYHHRSLLARHVFSPAPTTAIVFRDVVTPRILVDRVDAAVVHSESSGTCLLYGTPMLTGGRLYSYFKLPSYSAPLVPRGIKLTKRVNSEVN